jgi:hypothetical protein
MEEIIVNYKGVFHKIEKEPFETFEDAYSRAWFIIKNKDKYTNHKQLVSLSIIHKNNNKKMEYAI